MKRRHENEEPSEQEERQAVEELQQQLSHMQGVPSTPPPAYWANLLVRTNQRIDDASSAKAISISWAARVAIPGVVAILFFFIGLHYYAPEMAQREKSVMSLVTSLPQDAMDSLLVHPERASSSLSVVDVRPDIFLFSNDQINDYLTEHGSEQLLMENMDDADVASLLAALNEKKNL